MYTDHERTVRYNLLFKLKRAYYLHLHSYIVNTDIAIRITEINCINNVNEIYIATAKING
jgi:hypothetical protein